MLNWSRRRQERDITALKMSVTADSAVCKWVEEYCDILDGKTDDGVVAANTAAENEADRQAAREVRFAEIVGAYPYKSSPWTHVVTKHFLTQGPVVAGDAVRAVDVVDWICGCNRSAVLRVTEGKRAVRNGRRRERRDAAKAWLQSAEAEVDALRKSRKGRLLALDRAGVPYRLRQGEIHKMRRMSPLLKDAEVEILLREACARYFDGRKPRSEGEVVEVLRRAAIDGDSRVQRRLGLAQIAGDRVKRRSREGLMWLHRAASGGDAAARFDLGRLYASGRRVQRNRTIALAWFRLAADAGHRKARVMSRSLAGDLTERQKRVAARLAQQYEKSGSANGAFA